MCNILYEVRDGVAVLALNRPEHLNSVNPAMVDARAVLVRANGDHFMAGGDLKWFREQTALDRSQCRESFIKLLAGVQAAALNFRRMDKPVIAAVAGFGLSLMMAADLVVAAEEAYFTLAYSNIGLSPDGGASWPLPRQVGLKQAMEIALLGERFDARRAHELGLVNRLVPRGRLAGGSAGALARTKALINQAFDRPLEAQLAAEQEFFADCATHSDFSEGLSAFFERRKPAFGKD